MCLMMNKIMNNNKLYDVLAQDGSSFLLKMKDEHVVYPGHFPGQPITPGVLTMQMVRDCVNLLLDRQLHYTTVKNCRFVAMVRPGDKLRLNLQTEVTGDSVVVKAVLAGADSEEDIRLQVDAELQ